MKYRRDIDGLRGVAVAAVVFYHADIAIFSGGFAGVDMFFVISGYLITTLILQELQAGTFSLATFYERRARRILPALYLVMLACVPVAFVTMLPAQFEDFATSLIAVGLFGSNFYFWHETGYFGPAADQMPLLHTWSLGVEEQFYVVFPACAVLLSRLGKQPLMWLLGALLLLSMGLSEYTSRVQPTANFFFTPMRAWELLAGSMCAFYLDGRPTQFSNWLSTLGLILIAAGIFAINQETTPIPSASVLLAVAGTVLVIVFAADGTLSAKWLSMGVITRVGLISYSTYLWHNPLFSFSHIQWPEGLSLAYNLFLTAISFVLGYLSWRFVEKPFRNTRQITFGKLAGIGTASLAALLAIGWLGMATSGFLNRYPADDRYLASLDPNEQGTYVGKRFKSQLLHAFEEPGKIKLLVIGDSYAEDFVNALAESGLSARFEISTYGIRARCGNLFNVKDYSGEVSAKDRYRCSLEEKYDSASVQKLIRQADVVALASSWTLWEAKRLPESVKNLQAFTNAKILVVGRKNFGQPKIEDLIATPKDKRLALRIKPTDQHLAVNRLMEETLAPGTFLNIHKLICNADDTCPLFADNLKLISYDGGHLTRAGASLAGNLIVADPAMASLTPDSIDGLSTSSTLKQPSAEKTEK